MLSILLYDCYTLRRETTYVPPRTRIVGALSAGAVIESGDNANGNYVRFADGTQICWGKVNYGVVSVSQDDSVHTEWIFPAAFIDADVIVVGESTGYASNRFVTSVLSVGAEGAVTGSFSIQNTSWNLTGTTYYLYVAIGRWKE